MSSSVNAATLRCNLVICNEESIDRLSLDETEEETLATDAGRGGTTVKFERGAIAGRGFGFGVILPGVLGEIEVNRDFTGLWVRTVLVDPVVD